MNRNISWPTICLGLAPTVEGHSPKTGVAKESNDQMINKIERCKRDSSGP